MGKSVFGMTSWKIIYGGEQTKHSHHLYLATGTVTTYYSYCTTIKYQNFSEPHLFCLSNFGERKVILSPNF